MDVVPDKSKTGSTGAEPAGHLDSAPTIRMEPASVGDVDAQGDPARRFIIKPPSQVLPPRDPADDMTVDLEDVDDDLDHAPPEREASEEQELNIDDLEEIADEDEDRQTRPVATSPPPAPSFKSKPPQPQAVGTGTSDAAPASREPAVVARAIKTDAQGRSIDIELDEFEADEEDGGGEEHAEGETARGDGLEPKLEPGDDDSRDAEGREEGVGAAAPGDRVAPPPATTAGEAGQPEPGGDLEAEQAPAHDLEPETQDRPVGDEDDALDDEPPLLDLETGELTPSPRSVAELSRPGDAVLERTEAEEGGVEPGGAPEDRPAGGAAFDPRATAAEQVEPEWVDEGPSPEGVETARDAAPTQTASAVEASSASLDASAPVALAYVVPSPALLVPEIGEDRHGDTGPASADEPAPSEGPRQETTSESAEAEPDVFDGRDDVPTIQTSRKSDRADGVGAPDGARGSPDLARPTATEEERAGPVLDASAPEVEDARAGAATEEEPEARAVDRDVEPEALTDAEHDAGAEDDQRAHEPPPAAAETDDDAPTFPPVNEVRQAAGDPVIVGVIQVIGEEQPRIDEHGEISISPRTNAAAVKPAPAAMFIPPPPPPPLISELDYPFDDLDDGVGGDEFDDRVTAERKLDELEAELEASPLDLVGARAPQLATDEEAEPPEGGPDADDEAEELDLSEAEEIRELQAAARALAAKKPSVPPHPGATPAPRPSAPSGGSAVAAPPAPSASPAARPVAPPSEQEPASTPRRRRRKPWWEEIFNDDYLRSQPKYSPRQTQKEVDFIESALGIKEGGMLLDLACGNGRHAVELSSRGFQVVGLDLSLPMLARAAELAQKHGQKINFIHGDMRQIAFESTFDGACCIGTSFGFFDDEANIKVIEGVRRALKARGMLIIESVNRDYVIAHQPNMVWFEGDGCVCMEESSFNYITSRLKVKRTLLLEGGRQVDHEFSIRVYCLHELGKILHNAGFRVIEVSGHIHTPGAFFGPDSTNLVILAEKRLE